MTADLLDIVRAAAVEWGKQFLRSENVTCHVFQDDGEEPGRYVVSLSISGAEEWQAAEVWVEDGQVVAVNWLGEGLPPDGVG